ncbi:MAG: hypothetical protein N2D54_03200, partial [Chloroflexota bacterium]
MSLWRQIDWLLINVFLFMSLMIMASANIKADLPIVVIGLLGGLVIESWGTQTNLWTYYTFERPPLWIIPAWPIASLTIDRLFAFLNILTANVKEKVFLVSYWLILPIFLGLMVIFTAPTFDKSLTIMAILFCIFLILTPTKPRAMVLTFAAGTGLGYFLELWGTTRLCWTYYTHESPPLFAVLAHGFAAVAFWRVLHLYNIFKPQIALLTSRLKNKIKTPQQIVN